MSERATTALTVEQVTEIHDSIEAHDDDVLHWTEHPGARLRRPLPKCPTCDSPPTEIRMELPEQADGLIIFAFDACGHAFHTTRDVLAEGLRLHNARRQA